jgi:hypothetical protein
MTRNDPQFASLVETRMTQVAYLVPAWNHVFPSNLPPSRSRPSAILMEYFHLPNNNAAVIYTDKVYSACREQVAFFCQHDIIEA